MLADKWDFKALDELTLHNTVVIMKCCIKFVLLIVTVCYLENAVVYIADWLGKGELIDGQTVIL